MSSHKYLSKTFLSLPQEQLSHIEKLILRKCDLTNQTQEMKDQIYHVAPYIKNLRLRGLDVLHQAQDNGTLDLNNFSNLVMLSIVLLSEDKNSIMDNEFLYQNLMELTKLKKLKKLYLDLSSQSTEHYITEELVKLIPFFQQLESFRIEIGDNDIRDIGFQNIANTISPLKNLKQLQIGVEYNSLGNYSFENLISMISGLDNLESLQIDFWDNLIDYTAYERMQQELEGKPICKNLRKLRLGLQAYFHNEKESIKLFEGLALFTNIQVFYLQLNLSIIDRDTAFAFNRLLMNNKDTLETLMTDLNFNNKKELQQKDDCITNIYQNINQISNLRNLLLQFHTNQTLESSSKLFSILEMCKQLSRLTILTHSSEIQKQEMNNKINYFKQMMNMNSVLDFVYSKSYYELDSLWYHDFFEQDWKLKHFLDPHLISLSLQKSQEKNTYDTIKSQIEQLQEEVSDDENISDSEEEQEIDSDEDQESGSELSANSSRESIQLDEINSNQSDPINQEGVSKNNNKSEEGGNNKSLITTNTQTFEEYEKQYDKQHKKQIELKNQDMELYLITMRQFSLKKIEFLRAIVYQKYILDTQNTTFSHSPQMIRNFWDLYY